MQVHADFPPSIYDTKKLWLMQRKKHDYFFFFLPGIIPALFPPVSPTEAHLGCASSTRLTKRRPVTSGSTVTVTMLWHPWQNPKVWKLHFGVCSEQCSSLLQLCQERGSSFFLSRRSLSGIFYILQFTPIPDSICNYPALADDGLVSFVP